MKKNNTKQNLIYNMIYQILIMILPFITAPYLSRIIGKTGIGIYTYTYSIAHYFVLFSLMGLANYGNRKIAQNKDDVKKLNETFSEIYLMQIGFTVISLISYLSMVFLLNFENKNILIIQIMFVISAGIDISWFFYGMEKFKLMVVRNTIIKVITTICIFVFVKKASDLWKYAFIMAFSMFVSQLSLWVVLNKLVKFEKPSWEKVKKHIKPNLILFIPVIAVSLYRVMDKIMLGAISTMEQTGIYENADKLVTLPLTITSSVGTVMMPKMANIFAKGDNNKGKEYFRDSMQLIVGISIAMSFGMAVVANDFAPLYYGIEFSECGKIMIVLSPILLIGSISNVVRTQYLIPKEKDKIYILSVVIGAVVNMIINLILINKFGAMGAAIGTIFAELSVMLIQCILSRNELEFKKYIKDSICFVFSGIVMYVVLRKIKTLLNVSFISIIIEILIGIIIYGIVTIFTMFLLQRERLEHLIKLAKKNKVNNRII